MTPDLLNYILGTLTLMSIAFGIWSKVITPQTNLDKQVAIDRETTDSKATILAQQLQWEKEANERRFNEMGVKITESMTLAQNHIHTIDVRLETLTTLMTNIDMQTRSELTRLSTIIEERIPKKL